MSAFLTDSHEILTLSVRDLVLRPREMKLERELDDEQWIDDQRFACQRYVRRS